MKHNFYCRSNRIVLSPLMEKDIEELRLLRNKEREFFLTQEEINAQMQQKWYAKYLEKEDDIMFKISLIEEPDTFIGSVALYNIQEERHTCEVGRILVDTEKYSGKGIGTEAYVLACAFALDKLKMETVVAECRKENGRALNVNKKIGLQIVGETEIVYLLQMTQDTINRQLIK